MESRRPVDTPEAAAPDDVVRPSAGHRRLTELDALRGLGAILVVNFHFATRYAEMFPRQRHVPFTLGQGDYRVMLFFAISGFAIFFSLRRLRHTADFVAGRMARLFPAYWVAIALTLVVEHLGDVPQLLIPARDVWVNVTMLQSYFYVPAVDGAYWTLAIEIGFYASMLTLWALRGIRRIEPIIALWMLLRFVTAQWPDMPTRIAELLVLPWLPFFAIGMLSYRIWAGERGWRQQAPYLAWTLALLALGDPADTIAAAIVIVVLFAAMIEGRLRWLCVRPLTWFGGISYSLYLVHEHIGFVVMLNADRLGLDPIVGYGLALAVAVALGAALCRYVERPATAWLLAIWSDRKRPGIPDRARTAIP